MLPRAGDAALTVPSMVLITMASVGSLPCNGSGTLAGDGVSFPNSPFPIVNGDGSNPNQTQCGFTFATMWYNGTNFTLVSPSVAQYVLSGTNTGCLVGMYQNRAACGVAVAVSQLPSASTVPEGVFIVFDGATSSDCSTGGGSNPVACYSNGSTYTSIGGGGGGGGATSCTGTSGQILAADGTSSNCLGHTTGTGILTALGVNVGSAGAPVLFNGALGTPSSGVATRA